MLREKELKLLEDLKTDNARKTEEIQQLRNNQLIGQASGEEIVTITDGALAFANILEETEIEVEGAKRKAYVVKLPQGVSKQTTREGYNQFNSEIEIQNIKGVEISYDKLTGYIKLNGTVKTDVAGDKYDSTIFNLKNSGKISIKGNTNYTLSISKISGSYSTISQLETSSLIQLWDNSSGTWLYPYQLSLYNLKTSSSVSITKSQTTDVIYNQIQLTLRDGDVFDDLIIGIQFNEGELKPFEQYGATPSIEIPSEIENVKAYNLFDKSTVINNKYINATGNEIANNQWVITDYMEVDSNSNYTYFGITILGTSPHGAFYDSNKTFISSFKQDLWKNIIKIPENAKYIRFSINKDINNDLNTFIFYKGIEDKPYVPFGAISISLGNKNILPITYTKGQHIDLPTGITIDFIEKNRIKLNGTATKSLSLNTITGATFTWKKGKTYSLQLKIIEGSYSTQPLVLHTGFRNEFKDIHNNLQADISNNFKNTITIDEEGYSNKCIIYANSGVVFNNLIVEIQLEENTTTTEIVVPQKQNYNLHIKDLELNGIGDIRDSFVVEVDNSYSYKKVKKLYLKKKYNEKVFDTETINNVGFAQLYTNTEKNIYQYRTIRNFIADLLVNPDPFNIKDIALCNCKKKNGPNDNINSVLNDNLFTLSGNKEIVINSNKATYADFKNELIELNNNGNPLKILYPLETPELIDLTNDYPELVQDIENIINNMFTYEEVTHIDTPIGYMELTYIKSNKLIIKNYDDRIFALEQAILNVGGN